MRTPLLRIVGVMVSHYRAGVRDEDDEKRDIANVEGERYIHFGTAAM